METGSDNGTYLVSGILAGLIRQRNALWFGPPGCKLLPEASAFPVLILPNLLGSMAIW
jgi:hypothetical protein